LRINSTGIYIDKQDMIYVADSESESVYGAEVGPKGVKKYVKRTATTSNQER
jgi:hypothetical protein